MAYQYRLSEGSSDGLGMRLETGYDEPDTETYMVDTGELGALWRLSSDTCSHSRVLPVLL